jgi:hypothetical protein
VFAGTAGYRGALADARAANPAAPDPAVPALARLVEALARPLPASGAEHRRRAELRDAERALALASGVVLDALAARSRVVPGSTVEVEVQLWNGGLRPLAVDALEPVVPGGWRVEGIGPVSAAERVEPGALLVRRFRLGIPADAALSQAYFLSDESAGLTAGSSPPSDPLPRGRNGGPALYAWPSGVVPFGAPFEPPAIRARAVVRIADGVAAPVPFGIESEATFREVDLRRGELRRPVLVVPAVSVQLEPGARVVSTRSGGGTELTVRLTADAPEGIAGILRVRADGWRAEMADSVIVLAGPGGVRDVRVGLVPTRPVVPGRHPVHAEFEAGGRTHTLGVRVVDYPHVRARPLVREARGVLSAFDLRVPDGLRVAYVEGAGEEGPRFLADLGVTPVLLGAAELAEGDLDRFDVVVLGSRAFEVRDDLIAHNDRLLAWVERGGTMIVQYNKYEMVEGGFAPFPLTMARPHGRVTDPASAVRLLEPEHPALSWPNRIGPDDFVGWVQERGLYFADTWAPEYTPLLETGDAGDALRGGLLVARHGRGTWVYTGLALFRQLPEGVPGAYRLFANLLALAERR